MTLKEAYNEWAQLDENKTLAARTRQSVEPVLIKPHGDIEIDTITLEVGKRIFAECKAPMQSKAQAASTMVHVMDWAAAVKKIKVPKFIYSELAYAVFHQEQPTAPSPILREPAKPKPEKKAAPKKKKKGGKPFRKVCKLDPDTLQVLETFDSIKEAAAASGLVKLSSPLSRHQKGNGYYWCYAEEAATFKPAPGHGKWPRSLTAAQQKFEQAITDHISEVLAKLSDDDLIAEMRRRKWTGHITKTQNVEL